MDIETAKAINNISKRLNKVERKLERFLLLRQEITNEGLSDIGSVVSSQDEAIADLAVTVDELAAYVDAAGEE